MPRALHLTVPNGVSVYDRFQLRARDDLRHDIGLCNVGIRLRNIGLWNSI